MRRENAALQFPFPEKQKFTRSCRKEPIGCHAVQRVEELTMADRTLSPAGDTFLVWTAVVASLTTQLLLALLGLGAGILAVGAASTETIAWGGFLWWAASGIFAAAMGGTVIAALGEGIDDTRKTVIGPVPGMLENLQEGKKVTDEMRRSISAVAVSSVVALVAGAAAQIACAIYAPETAVRTTKRA
jgi:hypothetical protein